VNPITLHYSKSTWFGGLIVMIFMTIVTLGMAGFAILLLVSGAAWPVFAIVGLCALFMFGLGRYVGGDAWGKWRWRIDIDGETVKLRLPSGRSISHKLRPVRRTLARADIEAIEHRIEFYTTVRLANMQRCFALRLRGGERIILGEDRALNSGFGSHFFEDSTQALAENLGIMFEEQPTVCDSGGILAVWFVRAPPWGAPGIDEAEIARLTALAGFTGSLAVRSAMATTGFSSGAWRV
jgi:uncharacterized membrane protein